MKNFGTLDIDYSLTLDENSGTVTHENDSTIDIAANESLILGASNNLGNKLNGTIEGFGTLDAGTATFTNKGSLEPGGSVTAGGFTINANGTADLLLDSILEIELGGVTPVTQHDKLFFTGTGTPTLGGRLKVSNISAFTPSLANTFTIIASAATLMSSFDHIEGLDFSQAVVLDVTQTATSMTLTAVATDIVGTTGADVLGTATTNEYIVADIGNDTITVNTGDTAYGQGGDDTISAADTTFKRVDGGLGTDELEVLQTLDYRSFDGSKIENIEIFSVDDGVAQTVEFDATSIAAIVDGDNALTSINNSLVVIGDSLDKVILHGDFVENGEQVYDVGRGNEMFIVFTDAFASVLVDEQVEVEVNRTDGSVERLGSSGNDTLTGSGLNDFLEGRQGIDSIDGAGGNDLIVYEPEDTIDGGTEIDTLLVDENVDLTGVTNLSNIEKIDTSHGTPNTLDLNIADVLNWVGDNGLNSIIADGRTKMRIEGDSSDTIMLDGQDLTNIVGSALTNGNTSDFVASDYFSDGGSYIKFVNAANTVDLYIHSSLVDSDPVG